MTRIVLAGGGTGGHLMPALALAAAFQQRRADIEPIIVGAQRGVEATILPTRPYRFYLLPAEPIYRRQWWRNLRWPAVLPRLWRACREILEGEQPALVVGTGGYAAGPLLYAAHRREIPVALQEQNAFPGLATRWATGWARQVHLGFPEAAARLRPGPRTELLALGNPIVRPHPVPPAEARTALGIPVGKATLFVMGGSQGARAINEALAGALDAGALSGVAVLWSTGPRTHARFAGYDRPPDVQVRPFWDPIAPAYAAADLVLSRAGALTVSEITAWGLPAILVPLPSAAAGHQDANAAALKQGGAAVVLPESRLSADTLAGTVATVLGDPDERARMASAARERGRPGAAEAIVQRLLDLL